MKEKALSFGEGNMEEEEVEVSDSSQSGSGGGIKEKEMTHVSTTIGLGCVELIRDQFPETMDRVPSPVTISSPGRVSSKDNANPSIVQDVIRCRQTTIFAIDRRSPWRRRLTMMCGKESMLWKKECAF